MAKSAYEMDNGELIERFRSACTQLGSATSDPRGPDRIAEVEYLEGVLLARLERQELPFKEGDTVQSKSGEPVGSLNYFGTSVRERQMVRRVHYARNGIWFLEFEGIPWGVRGYPQFLPGNFDLVPSAVAAES